MPAGEVHATSLPTSDHAVVVGAIRMGWWRPYFFWELTGVQLLVPALEVNSIGSGVLGAVCVCAICAAERLLEDMASRARKGASSQQDDSRVAAIFGAQRLASGLVMLLLMSFSVPVFLWTILSLAAAERWVLHSGRRAARRSARDCSAEVPLTSLDALALPCTLASNESHRSTEQAARTDHNTTQ